MWYNKVIADISHVPNALAYYNKEASEAGAEVKLRGVLERASASLPGLVEYRYNQLQELEAILEHINISLRKERSITIRKYMENYNRELTLREIEKWIDGEPNVIALSELINEIAFVRNKFLGIMKGLEIKAFQLNNITRLRCAGIEDASV